MEEISYIYTPYQDTPVYKTLPELLQHQASKNPDKVLAIYHNIYGERKTIAARELLDQSTKLAKYFISKGVRKGDRIGLIGGNSLEWIIGEYGILMCGAIAIHMVLEVKDASDVIDISNRAKCKGILLGLTEENIYEIIEEEFTKTEKFVISLDGSAGSVASCLSDILSKPLVDTELPTIQPEDDAVVFTTSGSTGKPKMVLHSHFGVLHANDFFADFPVLYSDRPFAWLGGYPLAAISVGSVRVFMESNIATEKGNITKIWNVIKKEQCNAAFLMPYTLVDMKESLDELVRQDFILDQISSGGQIVEDMSCLYGTLCKQFKLGYGTTEAVVISSKTLSTKDVQERGDIGRPVVGVEVRIVDDDGMLCTRSEMGHIQTRGLMTFKQFLDNQDLTYENKTKEGWFKTGDIGEITITGNLKIMGRDKDIISRGTRKIIPEFIEEVLEGIPHMKESCVIGVPDKRLGEEICVCYIPLGQEELADSDVKIFCERVFLKKEAIDGLGEMPTYFVRLLEFPLLATGKVDRSALRRMAIGILGLE